MKFLKRTIHALINVDRKRKEDDKDHGFFRLPY
jgi:hypothetical protein